MTLVAGLLVLGGLFVLLIAAIVIQGLVNIPAEPPTVLALTFLGKRTGGFLGDKGRVLSEGWKVLPGYPFLFGGVPVQVRKRNKDLEDIPIWTPDRAAMRVKIALTWIPDRTNIVNFLNSGADAGVEDILEDIITERVRVWAQSPFEGPEDWKQAIGAKEEATAIILRSILGDEELPRIDSDFPTPLLLKFFAEPQRKPVTNREIEIGGAQW